MEAHELDTHDRAPRLTYWHKTLRSLLYLDLLSAESSNAGAGMLRHTLDMWHACWVTERHVSGAGALCALSTEAGCSPPQPLECSGDTWWPTCGNCHMCGSTGPRTRATTFVVTTVPAIATNSRSKRCFCQCDSIRKMPSCFEACFIRSSQHPCQTAPHSPVRHDCPCSTCLETLLVRKYGFPGRDKAGV